MSARQAQTQAQERVLHSHYKLCTSEWSHANGNEEMAHSPARRTTTHMANSESIDLLFHRTFTVVCTGKRKCRPHAPTRAMTPLWLFKNVNNINVQFFPRIRLCSRGGISRRDKCAKLHARSADKVSPRKWESVYRCDILCHMMSPPAQKSFGNYYKLLYFGARSENFSISHSRSRQPRE